MIQSSADSGQEPIKQDHAERLARSLASRVETELFRLLDGEVRDHVVAQFTGIAKGFYLRNDGNLGHKGIERTIMHKKFDQAENGKRK